MRIPLLLTLIGAALLVSGCTQTTPAPTPTPAQPSPPASPLPVASPAEKAQTTQWLQRKVACGGDFFDSHAHFDGLLNTSNFAGHAQRSLTPQDLAKRMNEHNVSCAVLFVAIPDINNDFDRMQESLSGANVGFLPFFPVFDPSQLSVAAINKVYKGREQALFGIGEIAFYIGPLTGTSLAADPWPAIFDYAAKENLLL